MKVAFIVPYPSFEAPSQRFRLEHYFPALEEQNIDFKVFSFLDDKAWKTFYKDKSVLNRGTAVLKGFWRRLSTLGKISKYDVIYVHREASPIGPPIFEWIYSKVFRKKLIYDFDDAIFLSDDSSKNPIISFLRSKDKVKKICKWSTSVSCGNQYLADFAKQYNNDVRIIPTVVNTAKVHNIIHEFNGENLIVGWTGTHSTLPYLDELYPIIEKLQKEFDFTLLVIANKDPKPKNVKYKFLPWNKQTEIEDLAKIDIGVMPLLNSPWAKGKCGFKAIQYMALGIPAIVSDVGVNSTIVDDKVNGYVVTNSEEWEIALRKLLQNTQLAKAFGKEARKKIVENYSVTSSTEDFLNLIES